MLRLYDATMADITTQFIGLTKKRAQDLAEAKNYVFRLIRIDSEEYFKYPDDRCDTRVCIEIDNGAVTKATAQ